MKIVSCLICVWIAFASPAAAAVVGYEYQGQPFVCPSFCDFTPARPETGTLEIDTALLPVASLADARLRFRFELDDRGAPLRASFSITTPDGSVSEVYSTRPVLPDFARASGVIQHVLFSAIDGPSFYALDFDAGGNIVRWTGETGLTGGGGDFFTGIRGDFYSGGAESIGPGAWTRVTPVPAPASGVLALCAFALLARFRRRA